MLIRTKVVTESGVYLGRVRDVEATWPDFHVVILEVRKSFLKILGEHYRIDTRSVVRIERQVLIVQDAVIRDQPAKKFSPVPFVPQPAPRPSLESRRK